MSVFTDYDSLTGSRFGKLVVEKVLDEWTPDGKRLALCKCDCGKEKKIRVQHLLQGGVKSCNQCGYKESITSAKSSIDLRGKRFDHLIALEPTNLRQSSNVLWKCRCDCGAEKLISSARLMSGRVHSCGGCSFRTAKMLSMYKKYWTPAEKRLATSIYPGMMSRCYNPNNPSYKNWGGRGITVCDEWRDPVNGRRNFINWALTHGYADDLTCDRKDVDGPYCPDNCRWIKLKEQERNRSNNRFVTIDGVSKTVSEWAEMCRIKPDRLYRYPDDKVITVVAFLLKAQETMGDLYNDLIRRRLLPSECHC